MTSQNVPEPIAVVGMALRVPGANTPGRFWRNVLDGIDSLTRPSAEELRAAGVGLKRIMDPRFVRAKPLIQDSEYFDAGFFDMSASEAERTDPAHRLFLECVWESLEHAGIVPARDGPVTGVFAGVEGSYLEKNLAHLHGGEEDPAVRLSLRLGSALEYLTARVAYKLDLTGPSFTVMAACATSLLAVHLAVQSLRRRECGVAIAGGACADVSREVGYLSGVEGMLSATGRIRPFDAAADGTIFGSGVGVVVLRPLQDALADGNPIHAVIRGSATTNDGNPPGKESFIAPSPEGQSAAISAALAEADVDPETMGYLEAHGTGTLLGDPIEVAALTDVYRRYTARRRYCALGSAKGNVGHLRTASGVVSLIKACLALERRILPPAANFETPNPRIDFESSPFYVSTTPLQWQQTPHPRRAGVSAFGFGGSNAHVVLEEHRETAVTDSARRHHLFIVSAQSETALARRTTDLGAYLEQHPHLPAADVAHTLQCGRKAMRYRACAYVNEKSFGPADLFRLQRDRGGGVDSQERPLVFLFPGQGSQHPGMGQGLHEREPVYRETVDHCADLLRPLLGLDVRTLLHTGNGSSLDDGREKLRQTANAQPALFVVEYALARLFLSWGAEPKAVLGHSFGELVAACVAGVFSLADGLRLVATRSRLMQQCEPGAMAAVFLSAAELEEMLPGELALAAANSPTLSVVTGAAAAVERFTEKLAGKGVGSRRLEASHAFHSAMMEPALPGIRAVLKETRLEPPQIPVISNITGLPLTPEQAADPEYWLAQLRDTVHFSSGVEYLLADGNPVFLELGPGRTLSDIIHRWRSETNTFSALADGTSNSPTDEQQTVLLTLGRVWSTGAGIQWGKFYGGEKRRKVVLPTYPFQRRRHWLEPPEANSARSDALKLYEPGWRQVSLDLEASREDERPWLIFRDARGLADAVTAQLKGHGVSVVSLIPGESFAQIDAATFSVRPGSRDDLRMALAKTSTRNEGRVPRVLHLWSVTGSSGSHNSIKAFQESSVQGFYTLLALAQAAYDQIYYEGLDVLAVADGLGQLEDEKTPLYAEKAALLGLCRCIPKEIPGLSMRCADIPAFEAGPVSSWLSEAIIKEARSGDALLMTALRPDGRYVEEMYRLPGLALGQMRLREGGVVLITGGLGGLGLTIAAELFEWSRARLVLTSRWEPPPRSEWPACARGDDKVGQALRKVLALERRGAEVLIVRADSADPSGLAAAVSKARSRFGALNGVVHAAGVNEPTPALHKSPESAERVFAPKVYGAFNLEEILSGCALDFFVHFSSQASYLPEPGQVDYSAANAVLDALARRRAKEQPGLSCAIGWGAWQEVGMAARDASGYSSSFSPLKQFTNDSSPSGAVPMDHPFLQIRQQLEGRSFCYRGVFRKGEHWVVDEHLFKGQPLLSGTTIVECVRRAFADHAAKGGILELSRVAFQRPLFIEDNGAEVEVRFAPDGNEERFELYSRPLGSEGDWLLNASGLAAVIQARTPAPSKPPPRDLSGDFPREPGAFLSAGPRFRCVRALKAHGDSTWAHVRLADEFLADMPHYVLHPALVDGAWDAITRRFQIEAVPYTIDAIRVYANPGAEFFVHGRRRLAGGSSVFDVQLVDRQGETLVETEGYVTREIQDSSLVRSTDRKSHVVSPSSERASGACRVVVSRPGDLDSIRREAFTPQTPGRGEVQIEVVAAGLNFRDLLAALGQLPDAGAGAPRLGSECSGVVRAVGDGVKTLRPGDAVVAIAGCSFATHVTAHADLVVPLPAAMSFEDAAAIPIVFLTADYALNKLARLEKGERVLIHAASGGVGLAAVQLARKKGAQVFATAGRPEKRDYLKKLGVDYVMDSRSPGFGSEIREGTKGEGVDVVLNSLAGEFIEASLGLLRPYGRFVELGKRDIYADTRVGLYPFRNNLSYHALDLGKMIEELHPVLVHLFHELMDRFACGDLEPLPISVKPLGEAAAGFKHMAHAEHIGKIVFQASEHADPLRCSARDFRKRYGQGLPVKKALDVFRRLLSSDEAPPYVLALGGTTRAHGLGEKPSGVVTRGDRTRPELATPYRAPVGVLEESLVKIWEKTIGVAPIGVDDNFFELGGDSITAILAHHAVTREHNVRLPVTRFLDNPTISSFAAVVRVMQETDTDPENVATLLAEVEAASEAEAAQQLAELEKDQDAAAAGSGNERGTK